MKTGTALLLAAVLFVAGSYADFVTISTVSQVPVGANSNWVFATASNYPNESITIAIAGDPSITFNPSTLNLNPTNPVASFTIRPTSVGAYPISFTINGDNVGQFEPINNVTLNVVYRTVAIDQVSTSPIVGIPSEPLQIVLSYPSTGDLTFSPSSNNANLQFLPGPVTVPANTLSASYRIITTIPFSFTPTQVSWSISGPESALYSNSSYLTFISSQIRTLRIPVFSSYVNAGNVSGSLLVYTPVLPNSSITITPTAVDTTFTPGTVTLSSSSNQASFTFDTASIEASKEVNLFVTGPNEQDYQTPYVTTMGVPMKSFLIDAPTIYVLTRQTLLSVKIPAPVANGVTVFLYAANIQFSPNNVSFSGSVTGQTVTVTPTNIGPDAISFLVTGPDAAYYNTPGIIGLSVLPGSFISPNNWYVPALWVGVQSDSIPVWVNIPPPSNTNVTLTPSAPDLIFNPPTLVFTSNTLEQYLTITPTAANLAGTESVGVSFLVGGADYAYFSTPASITVTIQKRIIQFTWSPDIAANTPMQLYLQKKYTVWATADYAGSSDIVTITPVSPYVTFNPSVITFNSGTLRTPVTATVNAGVVGITNIDYIIGGNAAGYYAGVASQSFSTAPCPLSITGATVAYDNREPGIVLTATQGTLSTVALAGNHIYDFVISTSVIPNSRLTITPVSPHINFNPSSIDLVPNNFVSIFRLKTIVGPSLQVNSTDYIVAANFSVTPKAAGVHEVYFTLSGPDGPYYQAPPHTFLSFKPYSTGDSTRVASSILVAFVVALSLFL